MRYVYRLATHPHHNYYEGRAAADITPWLAYFLKGMAAVFASVAGEVRTRAVEADPQTLRERQGDEPFNYPCVFFRFPIT